MSALTYIIQAFAWLAVGCIIGIAIAATRFAMFGDDGLNEEVEKLRTLRREFAYHKAEITAQNFIHWCLRHKQNSTDTAYHILQAELSAGVVLKPKGKSRAKVSKPELRP